MSRLFNPARRNILACFSPPVMVATMAIEIMLAAFTIWRYKLSLVTKLAVALLVCLATFQLAEFQVCGGIDPAGWFWPRVGNMAITMLPPLGLHLSFAIAAVRRQVLVVAAYASGAAFASYFLLANAMSDHQCLGNYVIFQVSSNAMWLYGAYYFGWLLIGLLANWRLGKHVSSVSRQRALGWLLLGYATFIVPTTAAVLASPDALAGVPSIMCGFAVSLAIILSVKVLPSAKLARRGRGF